MSAILEKYYDVVIAGGSSAAVGAALGAGRMGATVALIEDSPVLGGMLANGISNIDSYSLESLSGVFEEFRRRIKEHYLPDMSADPIFGTTMPMPRHIDGRSRVANNPDDGGRWEPHVADRVFKDLVAKHENIRVYYRHSLREVSVVNRRVVGLMIADESGKSLQLHAKVVVDATHEGDVAALAGVPYRVGREARSALEPHAGHIHFFNETGEILEGSTGQQDRAVVSYGLRLTVKHYDTSDGDAHLLVAAPPGYRADDFVGSAFTGRLDMPGRKSEMNANPVGNELQEINWEWPEASPSVRRDLYEKYKQRALCFLYYLQNERGLRHLGLPTDEYVDNGGVPYRVFVREARRIVGEETMCEADINPYISSPGPLPALRKNAIAVGHYPLDSKPVRVKTDLSRPDKGDGDFYIVNVCSPFQVPYGAIVPVGVDGLLVPAALSATHVAYSSIRMDPTWTVLGQAAGIAAVVSIRSRGEVREAPIRHVQRELLRQKCRLFFYWDVPLEHPAFPATQWLAVHGLDFGYPDRTFRPDVPLNRAEMAQMLVRGLELWLSVSGVHFRDVSPAHDAFREVETLFDLRALAVLGIQPRWPLAGGYNPARDADFSASFADREFLPDAPVKCIELLACLGAINPRWKSLLAGDTLSQVLRASEIARPCADASPDLVLDAPVTRGFAAAVISVCREQEDGSGVSNNDPDPARTAFGNRHCRR